MVERISAAGGDAGEGTRSSHRLDLPFTSVVVPVYRDAVRLRLCLDALGAQTYPASSFETIIVINADDRRDYRWIEGRPHTKILEEPVPGSYAARNCGIRSAAGEVLAFTDSDCIPDRRWLETGVRRLMEDDQTGMVGGEITVFFRAATKNAVECYDSLFHLQQKIYVEQSHFSCTANLFTRRDVFERVGTFNESRFSGGDREWGLRVHTAGLAQIYEVGAVALHPARASLRQLFRKERRMVGHRQRRFGDGSWTEFLRWEVARVIGVPKLTRGESPSLRVRVFAVATLTVCVRVIEALRLASGGKARR